MKAAIALDHMLQGSFYACTVVKLHFVTEHTKKKKKKNKAKFMPRAFPLETLFSFFPFPFTSSGCP